MRLSVVARPRDQADLTSLVPVLTAPNRPMSFDAIAERVSKRSEPRLKVPPLVEALAKDRPAYLLGTRRADAALGLVIFDAGRLEGEAAEFEDAANIALQVGDDVLMEYAQDAAGQHRIAPRLREVGTVLEGFPEGEAEIIAVDRRGLRACFDVQRLRDVLVGELEGFQVGQAPISVAEVRPRSYRRA
jgi:hypothetical protein